ncbi:endoglucanase 25-like protein [Tanacetum coccineum]
MSTRNSCYAKICSFTHLVISDFAAGRIPRHKNVSRRGNSYLNDGKTNKSGIVLKDLVGGFYDAWDSIKFYFAKLFAMTTLSWSVFEYNAKYEAAGKITTVKEITKRGTDYFLKNFKRNKMVAVVRGEDTVFHNDMRLKGRRTRIMLHVSSEWKNKASGSGIAV